MADESAVEAPDAVEDTEESADAHPTPAPSPSPTPTPTPTPSPTPTAVPTGPDDEGWAEHLGLTEEELEARRASDDFLEWAEPRRAREAAPERTMRRIGWDSPGDSNNFMFANLEELWPEVAYAFRDRLLANGTSLEDPVPGLDSRRGYVHVASRDASEDLQEILLIGFYLDEHATKKALIDQIGIEVQSADERPEVARGEILVRRSEPVTAPVGEDWEATYRESILPHLDEWAADHIES